MPATLGLIATHRKAGLTEFAGVLDDNNAMSFINKVSMELDTEIDKAYPKQWIGKVTVTTNDQTAFSGRVDEPKGDPGNTLSRAEIDVKARALALSGNAVMSDELDGLMDRIWQINGATTISGLFDT